MMSVKRVVRDGRTFVTSSYTNTDNTCVGVAVGRDHTGVLDTKDPDGVVLDFQASGWSSFLAAAKSGQLG